MSKVVHLYKIKYLAPDTVVQNIPSLITPEKVYQCDVKASKELQSKDSDGSTCHIEIALQPSIKYTAGDHLAVCPQNSSNLVHKVAERLKIDLNAIISLSATDNSETNYFPLNKPLSILNILTNLVDLHIQPKRATVATLASFATAVSEKKKTEQYECRYK